MEFLKQLTIFTLKINTCDYSIYVILCYYYIYEHIEEVSK